MVRPVSRCFVGSQYQVSLIKVLHFFVFLRIWLLVLGRNISFAIHRRFLAFLLIYTSSPTLKLPLFLIPARAIFLKSVLRLMSNWTLDFLDSMENHYMNLKTFGLKWPRFTLCLVLLIGWKYCKYHSNIRLSSNMNRKP